MKKYIRKKKPAYWNSIYGILKKNNHNCDPLNDDKSKGVPFHKACIAELQAAFKVGLKVNSGEESDLCPAVRMGYSPEVIKFLIDSGCDVNGEDWYDYRPMAWLLQYDYFLYHYDRDIHEVEEIAQMLIEAGADLTAYPHLGMDFKPFLHQASIYFSAKLVQMFLDAGVDVNEKSDDGLQALHYAAYAGNTEVIRLLVSRGADLYHIGTDPFDSERYTPFFNAVDNNSLEALELLMELGVDIDWQDDNGRTALIYAASYPDCTEAFNWLLKNGADTKLRTLEGKTPLHCAAQVNHHRAIYHLLKRGEKMDEQDTDGNTPLHIAAKYGRLAVTRLLLRAGADVQKLNGEGKTALDLAIEGKSNDPCTLYEWSNHDISTKGEHTKVIQLLKSIEP